MSETKDQTIARHDQHTAWKDGIDTIECDTDCRACTIARLEAELAALKAPIEATDEEFDIWSSLKKRVFELEGELAASREIGPCGKHPKMFWNRGRAPSAGSPLPEIEPYCTLCAELAATRAECYERAAETAHTYYLHLSNNGHSFLEHGVASDIRDDIRALITTSDAAAREDWIKRIRLEEAKDIRREQNLRIAKSFMDWLDDHIIELKTTAATENREQRAERFKRESGKKVHASDCATSIAPAEEPGPCDCDEMCTDAAAREDWIKRIRLEEAERVPVLCNRIIAELENSKVKWADHDYVWIDAAKTIVRRALLGDKYNEQEVPERIAELRAPVPAAGASKHPNGMTLDTSGEPGHVESARAEDAIDKEMQARSYARSIMLKGKQGAALNAVIEDYPEMWLEVQGAGDAVCGTCKGSQLSGKFDVDGNERPCLDCGTRPLNEGDSDAVCKVCGKRPTDTTMIPCAYCGTGKRASK